MNAFKKVFAVLLACGLSVAGLTACIGPLSDDPYMDGVEVDNTKTQLLVYNYNGGYGREWLYDIIERFEEEYKDYQGVNGKVGVQIIPDTFNKTLGTTFERNMGNNEIFFTESAYYYNFVRNGSDSLILDITDAVTTDLTEFGEDRSIFGKLSSVEQDFYLTDDGKVYAIPYRTNLQGIIYDVELFDEEVLYFAKGGCPSEYCTFTQENNMDAASGFFGGTYEYTNLAGERSAGPDGKYGTEDDGLPATYDEFFVLCDYMVSVKGITPFNWTGKNRQSYLDNIFQQFIVDYEGLDGYTTYLTYEGTADNLVQSIDDAENITFEAPTQISMEKGNGYLMSKSAGRYYAAKFFERLIKNDSYYSSGAFKTNYTHMQAQEDYIESKYERERYAFLLDGIWWENEANETFEEMAETDVNDSRMNRQFKLMQLPKATMDQVGEVSTYSDNMYSLCFVNATIAEEKIDLAEKFIRFCFTDESNIKFNLLTGCPRSMGYTLDSTQLSQLSMFGQSVYNIVKNQPIAYAFANNDIYKKYSSDQSIRLTWAGNFEMTGASVYDSFKYHSDTAKGLFTASTNILWNSIGSEF